MHSGAKRMAPADYLGSQLESGLDGAYQVLIEPFVPLARGIIITLHFDF